MRLLVAKIRYPISDFLSVCWSARGRHGGCLEGVSTLSSRWRIKVIAAPPCFAGMGPVSCQSCVQTPPPLRHVSPVSPPLSTSRKGWGKSRVVAFCRELRYFYRMSDVILEKPVSCKKRKRGAAQVKHCSRNE